MCVTIYLVIDTVKKKRKIRKKTLKKTLLLLIIAIISIYTLTNTNKIKATYYSYIKGHTKETRKVFLEEEIYESVSDDKYIQTLEEISTLLNKGYNKEDITTIYENLKEKSIKIILDEDYTKNIDSIITITFFKEDKLKRYIEYANKEINKDPETIVTYVNIGLDNSYYTNIQKVDNQDDLLVLVNKYNQLNENYIPENLQNVSYGSGKLRKEAALAFDQMCAAAKKDNIKIYGGSAYRSYSYQDELYKNYVARDGVKLADTYSARAGHSEHQTGLAMDILNKKWVFIEETDKEYEWLVNNSYKYGFILRYLKGKEEITGYKFEPWHYRYVGIDIAKEIHNLNITYDEYVAKK